jgi:hypothetical protein
MFRLWNKERKICDFLEKQLNFLGKNVLSHQNSHFGANIFYKNHYIARLKKMWVDPKNYSHPEP